LGAIVFSRSTLLLPDSRFREGTLVAGNAQAPLPWRFAGLRVLVLVAALGVLTFCPAAGAAPQQLLGKSVIISYSEMRLSRPVGGGPESTSTATGQFSFYISTAGRPFVRADRTLTTRRRGVESKAIDTGPGGGPIGMAVASGVQFSGNSMIVTNQMKSGARRITVSFDGSGCSATVVNAREGGKSMVIKSRYTGKNREVLSSNFSVTGCSVRDGNVFGG
jgi:hypothetical protein